VLGAWLIFTPAASDGFFKRLDFLWSQLPDRSCRQISEPDRPDGDATQLLHLVADAGQQAADFAIATFIQHHFEDRRSLSAALDSYVLCMGKAFRKVNTAMQLREYVVFYLPGNFHLVNLLNAMPGMRQTVGQLAIISNEDQSFAGNIEPAHAKYARRVWRHEVRHASAPCRVTGCRNHAGGFIDSVVNQFRPRQNLAINADLMLLWIDARAKLRDDPSIDLHSPFKYQLFAFAPAGDARRGEYLLQTLASFSRIVQFVPRALDDTTDSTRDASQIWTTGRTIFSLMTSR
jgi:hypothetical protein